MPRYTDFETVTVAGTAIGLTTATSAHARNAMLTVESASIRFRVDGGAPTASVGHLAGKGDVIILESAGEIAAFRAIRTNGTSASLSVSYGA